MNQPTSTTTTITSNNDNTLDLKERLLADSLFLLFNSTAHGVLSVLKQPITVITIHLQTRSQQQQEPNNLDTKQLTFERLTTIIKSKLLKLWTGSGISFVKESVNHLIGTLLLPFTKSLHSLLISKLNCNEIFSFLFSYSLNRFICYSIVAPLEILQVRNISKLNEFNNVNFSTVDNNVSDKKDENNDKKNKGMIVSLMEILKEKNYAQLYKSIIGSYILNILIYHCTYQTMNRLVLPIILPYISDDLLKSDSFRTIIKNGIQFISFLTSYPLQVIRRRLIVVNDSSDIKNNSDECDKKIVGMKELVKSIYVKEGMKGFYRGAVFSFVMNTTFTMLTDSMIKSVMSNGK
ncbi:hypothetical protein ABK040_002620 [Willaertia magna]